MNVNVEALHKYFAEQAVLPQRLGVVDCVTFVIGALKEGWGDERDFTHLLGYWDRRSAVDRLRRAGGLKEATTDVFGDLLPVSALDTGDIIWIPKPATLGLYMAPSLVLVKGNRCINRYLVDEKLLGWRVSNGR